MLYLQMDMFNNNCKDLLRLIVDLYEREYSTFLFVSAMRTYYGLISIEQRFNKLFSKGTNLVFYNIEN